MTDLSVSTDVVILVVEDDSLVRMIAVEMATDAGFNVLEAGDADEAIGILEGRRDVRVVFTDIDMPGSMDGLKLAIVVRRRWPPIEVILTSGKRGVSEGELPERCVFLPKPYKCDRVIKMLRHYAA